MKACYRMGILILFIVSVFYTDLYSQIPAFTWAQGIGGTSSEISNDITVDFTGNLYITGSFEGTVDFDAGPGVNAITSNGVFDIFILKLDASGNLIWVRSLGGTEDDFGYSISTDATGNCYVTGSFKSMVDFDPGIPVNVQTSAGGDDAFILKLDAAGNMLWVRILGGIGAASGKAIEATSSGYLYITGSFSLTNDFNPGIGTTLISSAGNSDGFICKLNQTGNFEWAGAVGGVNSDATLAIAVDDFGDAYSTGAFSGTADFDPGAGVANIGSAGYNDVFITKWDASGNYIWAKNIGGLGNDMGRDILIDTNGSVYTTGYFMGTADFNPGNGTYGLTAIGGWDAFVAILDSYGNFSSAKTFGGSADDSGNTLELDGLGNLYLTGGFKNTVDFDPGVGSFPLTSSGLQDVFISKFSSAGNFIWAKTMGGIGFDVGIAMALGSAFDIYLTGTFSGTADFNPPYLANLYSNGNEDLFVAKYNQSLLGIGENSSDKSFAIYPNPTNTFFTVQLPEIIVRVAIEFTELNGRVIRKATMNNTDTLSIYVGDLAEGVYLVKVVGEERSYFKRVIIIRD